MVEKEDIVKYVIIGVICIVLIGIVFVFKGSPTGYTVFSSKGIGDLIERGANWDKFDKGNESYELKIYTSHVNYYNGSNYIPIVYGPYGGGFRDWNGFIYRISADPDKSYINLYDAEDNYISSFGFGITGDVGGNYYRYTTLNFTWNWSSKSNVSTGEYVFSAYNNNPNFNWTQEYHFYSNQSMKIKNKIANDIANINNTKFWFIQLVGPEDGIWFNGTRYNENTSLTGEFDSLIPKVKFEDYYVFDYQDLLNNSFNITDFYLGDGSVIGVDGQRILAVGITKGTGFFPNGASVTVDPSVKIGGDEGGEDAYVASGSPNGNFGDNTDLQVRMQSPTRRTYLKFNISEIPAGQEIDNASFCLYMYDDTDGADMILVHEVYDTSWCEGDGGSDGSPACEITWNNQPCDPGFDDSANCNLTFEDVLTNYDLEPVKLEDTWHCFSVGNMIENAYSGSNEFAAMALVTNYSSSADKFFSKQYSNASLIPYLNVTYHTADAIPPNISIESPLNQTYGGTNILVNISASDPNLEDVWFYDGSENISYVEGYYDFNEGQNIIIAYANDSNGNVNLTSVDFYLDATNPVVSIIWPQQGATYGYNESIELNFSVSDLNLDSCWYNINDGTNISVAACINTSFDVPGNGDYEVRLFANDSLGNEDFDNVSFSVQVGAPSITLYAPLDVYLDYDGSIEFSYIPEDIDLEACELWGNFSGIFGLNVTDTSVTSGMINTFDINLTDNMYKWNIGCNDSVGNYAFNGNRTFYVDTIDPNLSLIEPFGIKTSLSNIQLKFSFYDKNPVNCFYNITTSIGTPIVSNVEVANCSNKTFNVSTDGDYVIYLLVKDGAGNTNLKSSSFSVDTDTEPPVIDNRNGGGRGPPLLIVPGKLLISNISDIITREGSKEILSLSVENIGGDFLNDCRLIVKGEVSSWIYSNQITGIAPGESIDFIFDLNVPEEAKAGSYLINLSVLCEETNKSKVISLNIPEGLQIIKINEIRHEKGVLNISYSFDNSNVIGNAVSIEIWILDSEENEILRTNDVFPINKDGLIERNVLIPVSEDLIGIYTVYFALSDDLDNYVRQSIVLGEARTIGRTILDSPRNKAIGYAIFVLIIGIGAFLVARKQWGKSAPKKAEETIKQGSLEEDYELPSISAYKGKIKSRVKKVLRKKHK